MTTADICSCHCVDIQCHIVSHHRSELKVQAFLFTDFICAVLHVSPCLIMYCVELMTGWRIKKCLLENK